MNKEKKDIYIIICVLLALFPFFYFKTKVDLDNKITHVTNELKERVKQTDLILDFMADLPVISNSIDFNSYTQIDKSIESRMNSDKMLEAFYILDENLSILYSKNANYKLVSLDILRFLEKDYSKSTKSYYFWKTDFFILKKINQIDKEKYYYLMVKLFIADYFVERLKIDGIEISSYPAFVKPIKQMTVSFDMLKKRISLTNQFYHYVVSNFSYILIVICIVLTFSLLFIKWFIKPFQKIIQNLRKISEDKMDISQINNYPRIFHSYFQLIFEANTAILNAYKIERELVTQRVQYKVAQQVAHDIRSPLTVIKTLKKEMNILPENIRRIFLMSINRIEEITLNLLRKNENASIELEPKNEQLLTLIENILIEKRIEFRNNEAVRFSLHTNKEHFDYFVKIRKSNFKRLVSNLINNSVEACHGKYCEIIIMLDIQNEFHILTIADNGPGIDSKTLKNLFNKGFTTKIGGNGLGLFSAKEELESLKCTIDIESSIRGTTVKIKLPIASRNSIFIKSLNLNQFYRIIIIDDDVTIHELYQEIFLHSKIELLHFYTAASFVNSNCELNHNVLLLVDYEFVGEQMNGIDIIIKLKHEEFSILVTARSDEDDILQQCEKYNIKILPKNLIPYVPLY